ncbi:hypothetical protein PEC302107_37090 [Pectobacterium araliae]|uniref:Uncharacterized protein n=1 Tax=Pectobacterium araliae TaxID=3073862 RepID=A0AAN0KA84_9GAMM|nr:hypothetical protein PEC302110_16360 [Pectobacterium sp. MAFF 302110]GKW21980.1 hypothetical protein PEC302107_37090 [Pectobacterium carotovorum subsp. carotovorum]
MNNPRWRRCLMLLLTTQIEGVDAVDHGVTGGMLTTTQEVGLVCATLILPGKTAVVEVAR